MPLRAAPQAYFLICLRAVFAQPLPRSVAGERSIDRQSHRSHPPGSMAAHERTAAGWVCREPHSHPDNQAPASLEEILTTPTTGAADDRVSAIQGRRASVSRFLFHGDVRATLPILPIRDEFQSSARSFENPSLCLPVQLSLFSPDPMGNLPTGYLVGGLGGTILTLPHSRIKKQ